MRISLTRTIRFRATHRYWKPEWTPEQNRARFGPLTESHPHHYACAVTVTGPLEPETARVMDLALLDQVLEGEVRSRFEGRPLEQDLPLPTCEAIAREIFTRLAGRLPAGIGLESVQVAEDDTLSATVTHDR
jgi:6-pyruvoyltetrahydropterin/6-carboxytetrahydropterin synthase